MRAYMRESSATPAPSAPEHQPVGEHERRRRAEALRRHQESSRASSIGAVGELSYLRAQLRLASRLTARLAATNCVEEMVELVVEELHGTFTFYLAAVQRLDPDGVLRLIAGRGALAEVMTEFLLLEQSREHGINGRVARSATTALVNDTRLDSDYIVRDPDTDPRSELSVPILLDGAVWGVLNIESPDSGAFSEADAVLVEAIAASLGSSLHRAMLVTDLEQTFTTTLTALMSTVEAKDEYTASHEQQVAELAERVAVRLGEPSSRSREVRYAALLHDVGKVAVPSEILLKAGSLDDAEWAVMKTPRGRRRRTGGAHRRLRASRSSGAREPRALGRRGLPRRARRRADPARGAHHRRLRHLRGDGHRPPLPQGVEPRRRARRARARERLTARRSCGQGAT